MSVALAKSPCSFCLTLRYSVYSKNVFISNEKLWKIRTVSNVFVQFIFKLSYKFTLRLTRCRIKKKYGNDSFGFESKMKWFTQTYHIIKFNWKGEKAMLFSVTVIIGIAWNAPGCSDTFGWNCSTRFFVNSIFQAFKCLLRTLTNRVWIP